MAPDYNVHFRQEIHFVCTEVIFGLEGKIFGNTFISLNCNSTLNGLTILKWHLLGGLCRKTDFPYTFTIYHVPGF